MSYSKLRSLLALSCLLALGSSSCGDDEDDGAVVRDLDAGHDHDASHHHDGAHDHDAGDDIDEDELVPCAADYPVYKTGTTVRAGDLTVRLLSISPEPPRQKTPNDWVFSVEQAGGAPATGVTFANPQSYMPVHRHYGRTPPVAAVGTQPGQVLLNDIDFKMRGPWQVNFDVVPAGGQAIPTTIQICVE